MTRARTIELLERLLRAEGESLQGREMLEAAAALWYAIVVLREHVTDRTFDAMVKELAPWFT